MKIISALLFLLLLLAGCNLGHGQFRPDVSFNWQVEDCTPFSDLKHSPELAIHQDVCVNGNRNSLSFAFIEFRDDGRHWNTKQRDNVLKEIERVSRNQLLGQASPGGVEGVKRGEAILLVLYVHGWRHNASESSLDLHEFRSFAHDLAVSPTVCRISIDEGNPCPPEHKPHVLAVYLGWRGDPTGVTGGPFSFTPLRHLIQLPTFWNRKQAAREVAGVAMTEAILTTLSCIDAADRWRHEAAKGALSNWHPCKEWYRDPPYFPDSDIADKPKKNDYDVEEDFVAKVTSFSKSRKILIGHSFGGRILELAVAQAYLGDRTQSLQLYESNFDEYGTETIKLEALRTQKGTTEKAVQRISDNIKSLQYDKRRLEGNVRELKIRKAVAHKHRNTSQERLSSATTTLENWMYIHDERRTMLQPCELYERATVERCANEAEDVSGSTALGLIGCAADRIQCLNDTYLCAIEKSFIEFQEINKTVKLQDVLACDVEGVRPSPSRLCLSGDTTDIGPRVLKTLESSYRKADPTDVTGVREVAGEWADFYCSLRRQPMAGLSALVGELRDGVESTNGTGENGEHWTAFFEEWMSLFDQFVGLISGWVRAASRHASTKYVEKKFADQVEGAKAHLKELVDAGRRELHLLQQVVRRETKRIGEIDAELNDIRRNIGTLTENVGDISERIQVEEREWLEERTRLGDVRSKEAELVEDIWYGKDEYLRPPADLVLLMNSASEASISLQLLESMSGFDVADALGVPVPPAIMSITSRSDWATRGLFPVGSWLGRLARFGPRAERGNWGLAYGTLGHQRYHLTHKVHSPSVGQARGQVVLRFSVGSDEYVVRRTLGPENENNPEEIRGSVDYWVVNVPPDVIANHDQIFSDDQGHGGVDRAQSRRPLLGIVEGLIKDWRLFEPRCAKEGEEGNYCGFLKRNEVVGRAEAEAR